MTKEFSPSVIKNKDLQLSNEDVNYHSRYCNINTVIADFPKYHAEIDSIVNTNQTPKESLNEIKAKKINKDEFVTWYEGMLSSKPTTVPIFKFYPANRGLLTYSEQRKTVNYLTSQLEAWSNIYQDSISYSKFFNWFFENETNELRLQRDANDFGIQSPDLRDVRIALSKAFEHIGYSNSVKIKSNQVKREGNSKLAPSLVLEDMETKQEESLDNKSDGEKAIITLIADIAYNLSLAKDFTNGDDFLLSPGVVIIDEIETHLHPNWQRQIIPMLTSIFPNIQLFIATHSPQIVGSVKSESVFVCDNFRIDRIKKANPPASLITYSRKVGASYKAMDEEVKEALKGALLDEQGWICGYCQQRIGSKKRMKVEHYCEQSICNGENWIK